MTPLKATLSAVAITAALVSALAVLPGGKAGATLPACAGCTVRIDRAAWGLAGDGVTNDGPALRSALEQLDAAGVTSAVLENGDYLIDRDGGRTWSLELLFDLRGESRDGTILRFDPGATNAKGVYVRRPGLTLRDLTLRGRRDYVAVNRHNLFLAEGSEGARVINVRSELADGDGFYVHKTSNVRLVDVAAISNRRNGVTFGSQAHDLKVIGGRFEDTGTQHIDSEPALLHQTVDDVEIAGAYFGASGSYAITTCSDSWRKLNRSWNIHGNTFVDNGGVRVFWVRGARIHGNTFFARRLPGSLETDLNAKQVHVDVDRRVQHVAIYDNDFEVNRQGVNILSWDGDRAEDVTVRGNRFTVLPVTHGEGTYAVMSAGGADTVIADNHVRHLDGPAREDSYGFAVYPRLDMDTVVIRDNIVRGAHYPIQVRAAGMAGRIRRVEVVDNWLYGGGGDAALWSDEGIADRWLVRHSLVVGFDRALKGSLPGGSP